MGQSFSAPSPLLLLALACAGAPADEDTSADEDTNAEEGEDGDDGTLVFAPDLSAAGGVRAVVARGYFGRVESTDEEVDCARAWIDERWSIRREEFRD